jgi:hypothetical protein
MGFDTDRILRIASASGSVTDRRHALAELSKLEDINYIVGDWMSEYNMATRGGQKINSEGLSNKLTVTRNDNMGLVGKLRGVASY